MSLTQEQKKGYIRSRGARCPYCKSTDIEGSSVEIDAGGATQEIFCNNCDKEWVDYYKLADVIEMEVVE